jgi:hypothetical protein
MWYQRFFYLQLLRSQMRHFCVQWHEDLVLLLVIYRGKAGKQK